MVGFVSGTKCLNLIWDVSEAIEGLLNIFVVESFEAVEEIAKNIVTPQKYNHVLNY